MATQCLSFELEGTLGSARAATLTLTHGQVTTPAFMPVGTRGSVRGVHPVELKDAGSTIVLANTYHLWDQPGHERIRALGGLHKFMGWKGPILTDSGGYQIFSLKDHLKLTEEGVTFRSPRSGAKRHLTPELAVEIQEAFGVDIAMAFDECLEYPATRERAIDSTNRTTRWLKRCLAARKTPETTALFGIVQGGTHEDLRVAHTQELAAMDLDGYAIGGLSVGEGHEIMMAMVDITAPHLPVQKPRYLMGVGQPVDLVEAIARGVDMFDCVLPTRAGRHGQAYTWSGKRNLKNARYEADDGPLDPQTPDSPANAFSRAYLRHLTKTGEMLGKRLISLHNLHFYQQLMSRARSLILAGDEAGFAELRRQAAVASRPARD